MALYSSPKSILAQKLNETLAPAEESIISDLMELALLRKASVDSDLLLYTEIYKLLGMEKFTELVSLLDGRTLQLPDRDDFRETLLMVLSYHYRSEGKNWEEIKDLLGGVDINTIRLGVQDSQFEKFIKKIAKRLNK